MGASTVDLSDLRGSFAHGWTTDDIDHVLGEIKERTGMNIICVWEYVDSYGCGGHSDLAVAANGDLHQIPNGLWEVLVGGHDVAVEFGAASSPHPEYAGSAWDQVDGTWHNAVIR